MVGFFCFDSGLFAAGLLWPLRRNLAFPDRESFVNQAGVLHADSGGRLGLLHIFRIVRFELGQRGLGRCFIFNRQIGLGPARVTVGASATRHGSGICVPGSGAVLGDPAAQVGNLSFLLLAIVRDGFHLGWQLRHQDFVPTILSLIHIS